MAVPPELVRASFVFTLTAESGNEDQAIFDLSLALDPENLPSDWDATLLSLATAAYNAWGAGMVEADFPPSVVLAYVQTAHFNSAGHTLHEQRYAPTTKWAGTGDTGSLPWQCAYVISLYGYQRTLFVPDAKRKRGRVYLPPFSRGLPGDDAECRLTTSQVSNKLSEFATVIDGVTDEAATGLGYGAALVVWSRVAGALYPVSYLYGDQIIDTQRRRRRQLSSAYQGHVV